MSEESCRELPVWET